MSSRIHSRPTLASDRNNSSKARLFGKPAIKITANSSNGLSADATANISTMDVVQGTVTVSTLHNTCFENIEIMFTGTSQVSVPSILGPVETLHRFLTLTQPADNSNLPSPGILEAGKTYTWPFNFTLPQRLLPSSCSHPVNCDSLRDNHLMLPPTLLGPKPTTSFGTSLMDSLVPNVCKITYVIRVRITERNEIDTPTSIVHEETKTVRVEPIFKEQAPLAIDNTMGYRSYQQITFKKKPLLGTLGTMVIQAAQPKPLIISQVHSISKGPATTLVNLLLRFDPAKGKAVPPELASLRTKLKIITHYASRPCQTFPVWPPLSSYAEQGVYSKKIALSTLCMSSVSWKKNTPTSQPSQEHINDSDIGGIGAANSLSLWQDYSQGTYYTAEIRVPIVLPHNMEFIPTFHSCLISRTYVLGLYLSAGSNMSLKLPVQICAEGPGEGSMTLRAGTRETATVDGVADASRPGNSAPPSPLTEGNENGTEGVAGEPEPPPKYTALQRLQR